MFEFFMWYVKFQHKMRIACSFEPAILIYFYRGVISQPLFDILACVWSAIVKQDCYRVQ
mgnify:CR=1 FL=1